MVAVLQAPPRPPRPSGAVRRHASSRSARFPISSSPTTCPSPSGGSTSAPRVVQVPDRKVVHRQPRPRATRSQRAAVYWRRRLVAAALGLGVVLTAAHAGCCARGFHHHRPASRSPHVETVVVQSGDTLWTIAQRLAPGSDPRPWSTRSRAEPARPTVQPGEIVTWPS